MVDEQFNSMAYSFGAIKMRKFIYKVVKKEGCSHYKIYKKKTTGLLRRWEFVDYYNHLQSCEDRINRYFKEEEECAGTFYKEYK